MDAEALRQARGAVENARTRVEHARGLLPEPDDPADVETAEGKAASAAGRLEALERQLGAEARRREANAEDHPQETLEGAATDG